MNIANSQNPAKKISPAIINGRSAEKLIFPKYPISAIIPKNAAVSGSEPATPTASVPGRPLGRKTLYLPSGWLIPIWTRFHRSAPDHTSCGKIFLTVISCGRRGKMIPFRAFFSRRPGAAEVRSLRHPANGRTSSRPF